MKLKNPVKRDLAVHFPCDERNTWKRSNVRRQVSCEVFYAFQSSLSLSFSLCAWILFRPLQLLYKLNPGWYIQQVSPVFIKYGHFWTTRGRFTDNVYGYILNDVTSSTVGLYHGVKLGTHITREGCVQLEGNLWLFSAKKLWWTSRLFCPVGSTTD
jgi:hypothetical protein